MVIVGGGYTGMMAAARLAWRGRAVALLEQNALAGQILLSDPTARAAERSGCKFTPRPPIKVKNRVQPVPIFEVEWRQAPAGAGGTGSAATPFATS